MKVTYLLSLVLPGTPASAPGRKMSKQLSMPADDEAEQRIDAMHRQCEFRVAIKVCGANC